ncbi:MAG: hypothetical protein A2Y38_20265 [Spirochaetes bacterium GWB1_59_5]|nr:MAG: hypothetical protein A2Y38_20265 [Spirochaetes bacterium GWB1_59_5]
MDNKPLLTTKEAASFLGLSAHTLRQNRSTGKLKIPFVRFGHAVRYRMEDLQAFIVQNLVSQ